MSTTAAQVTLRLPAAGSGRTVTAVGEGDEEVCSARPRRSAPLRARKAPRRGRGSGPDRRRERAPAGGGARARSVRLEASRRRIVEAADAQRRRLEEGAAPRGRGTAWDSVAALLAAAHAEPPEAPTRARPRRLRRSSHERATSCASSRTECTRPRSPSEGSSRHSRCWPGARPCPRTSASTRSAYRRRSKRRSSSSARRHSRRQPMHPPPTPRST